MIEKLKADKMPQAWIGMVEHYQELDKTAETQFLGESLPQGLKLIDNGPNQ